MGSGNKTETLREDCLYMYKEYNIYAVAYSLEASFAFEFSAVDQTSRAGSANVTLMFAQS